MGGSHYFATHGYVGNTVPKVNAEKGRAIMNALSAVMQKGLVKACHDLSEGGIGVAAAEMAFAGGLGMAVSLKNVPLGEAIDRDDYVLFAESNSRFLVEVSPQDKKEFENALHGVACAEIGRVTQAKKMAVTGRKSRLILSADIAELKEAWQKPLRW
jgi:phosphoribosylformylglycinamidine synthase subunit PurSL